MTDQWEGSIGNVTAGRVGDSFEQTATGYDPSIGRVVVEQSNNAGVAFLNNVNNGVVTVKASPGYIHDVNVLLLGALSGAATHIVMWDNTAGSGTVLGIIPLASVPTIPNWPQHVLFTTGLTFTLNTLALDGTGALTISANIDPPSTFAYQVECAYR
jgi:hypothetical protein